MCKKLCSLLLGACLCLCAAPSAVAAPVEVSLSSRAAVLYEPFSERTLFEKDAHVPLPMASTTKLMTALLAAEYLPWESTITVSEEAVRVEGSSLGLRAGDTLTARDLVTGLLHASGNDAAGAVALAVCERLDACAARMNDKAAALGMQNSTFVTPSGLDAEGHAASAYDLALLAAEVLKNPVLAEICAAEQAFIRINGVQIAVTNHNRLLKLYPDAVGMKTGYTDLAGKCLVSAARRDGVLLIAVTLNGGDYWNDHIALYEAGFAQTEAVALTPPALPSSAVAGGSEDRVALVTEAFSAVLLKGEKTAVKAEVSLPHFVWAPVEKGEPLGVVSYYLGDRLLGSTAIAAAKNVEERPPHGYRQRVAAWLRGLWYSLIS